VGVGGSNPLVPTKIFGKAAVRGTDARKTPERKRGRRYLAAMFVISGEAHCHLQTLSLYRFYERICLLRSPYCVVSFPSFNNMPCHCRIILDREPWSFAIFRQDFDRQKW